MKILKIPKEKDKLRLFCREHDGWTYVGEATGRRAWVDGLNDYVRDSNYIMIFDSGKVLLTDEEKETLSKLVVVE